MIRGSASDTPAEHRRDFVFVDDVAQALLSAALRKEQFGGVSLNISGAHIPHSAVVSAVESALGKPVEKKQIASDAPTVDPLLPAMSLDAAKAQLSWEPKVDIVEGVRRYTEHLKTLPEDTAPVRRCLKSW